MLDGKQDFADFRDEQSESNDERLNMSELLARLAALENELGHFVREIQGKQNSTRMAREDSGK
jgi:hypothetical protein